MLLYIGLFFFILLVNYLADRHKTRQIQGLFLSFLVLSVFVGVSDMLGGYDRYIYGELFDEVAYITHIGSSYNDATILKLYSSEFGYAGFNILISSISGNRYVFILLTTLVIYTLYYYSLKKYCINFFFAVALFLGLMFFFTFTYLRQMIGVGIVWLGVQYIYKRNPYKFIGCVLLAATFHNSAIIVLPLYFVPLKRFNTKHIMVFMFFCLLLGLSAVPSALFSIYGDVADMQLRSISYADQEVGFRYEYIIEAFIFLYIVIKNYDRIPYTEKDSVLLNVMLGFCAILLLFVQSLNGGRLGWYYLIGVIATLSTICNDMHVSRSTKILVLAICFGLFARIVMQWGYLLSPYKTFFTNGVRDYDPVYDRFEYDSRYAVDKFYKK